MIRKFKRRFILAAMVSVFIVLSVILGIANAVNYRRIVSEADRTVTMIMDNDGKFPGQKGMRQVMPPKKKQGTDKQKDFAGKRMSPELPFESRYFYVVLDKNGKKVTADTGKIAAVNETKAVNYAKKVQKQSKRTGFYKNYRYLRKTKNGQSKMVFLDCGRNLDTFYSFLRTSILTAISGMIAVFLLVLLFSRRIVKPVAESYEKQKRFITDAGHEIKTPLTIIDADAQVLELEKGESEWLHDISRQTEKLRKLTDNLIYLSRMEENKNPELWIDFPISDIVDEASLSFQTLAVTQGKTFTSETEPMLTYYGNEQHIQRLVEILLENAVKYSNPKGQIHVKLKKSGKNIILTVFNTAEKVDRKQLEHIFERFYRMDASRNSETGGYGIGLSIAQAIVQEHKGKITATTDDEKSMRITVQL